MNEFKKRYSYSIEAEDLLIATLLERVVKHEGAVSYIDIGSAHPIENSNTFYFYERGGRGICVEPNVDFVPLYAHLRPGDKLVNVGISDNGSGSMSYHRFGEALINGFISQDIIDMHVRSGERYEGAIEEPCVNVRDFLRDVDFHPDILNIDVETLEPRILGAWDWTLCRPKVICAEVHSPSIDDMLTSDVAVVLRNAGYVAMSRGWLSSIFVASEHVDQNWSSRD